MCHAQIKAMAIMLKRLPGEGGKKILKKSDVPSDTKVTSEPPASGPCPKGEADDAEQKSPRHDRRRQLMTGEVSQVSSSSNGRKPAEPAEQQHKKMRSASDSAFGGAGRSSSRIEKTCEEISKEVALDAALLL